MLNFGNPYTNVGVELMEPVRQRGLSTTAQDSTPYSTLSQFKDIAKRPGSCITAITALLAGGKVEGREQRILHGKYYGASGLGGLQGRACLDGSILA